MKQVLFLSAIAVFALSACQKETVRTANEARIIETQSKIGDCADVRCETLNIDRGLLEDFSLVASLPHVTALRMSWTDFDDLADIQSMTQLRELHISSTEITSLEGIDTFQNLNILHVQWNREVQDFTPIGKLESLTELALGGNNVGDMEFVENLINLDGLSLVNGTVTSFEALRGHPNLSRLDLEMTVLPDDISPLLTIPNLKQVSIRAGGRSEVQNAILDQLRARGVEVEDILEAVVVIC